MAEYSHDRERIHGELGRYRTESQGKTDFVMLHQRDLEYLLRIADTVAQVAKCEVTHMDRPKGYTCLDQMADAAQIKQHRYGESYRAEILNGEHLCDGCQLRAALCEF